MLNKNDKRIVAIGIVILLISTVFLVLYRDEHTTTYYKNPDIPGYRGEDDIVDTPLDNETDNEIDKSDWGDYQHYDITNYWLHYISTNRLYKLEKRPYLFKELRINFWLKMFNRAVVWDSNETA